MIDPTDAREPSKGVGGLPVSAEQLRAWSRPDDLRSAAMVVGLLGAWAGLGALVLAVPLWLKIPLWVVLAFVVMGVVQLGHETWHQNLFRRPWVNAAVGHAVGLLFGLAYDAARHVHLRHHWYNRTPKDPDAYNVGAGFLVWFQFYLVVFAGLILAPLHFGLLYPLMAYTRREWLGHALWFVSYAAVYAVVGYGLVRLELVQEAAQVWWIPLAFASPLNGLKSIADHYDNAWQGDRFHSATTVRTAAWLSGLWSGLNYHLDHHLFPRVPGHRLAQVHAAIREDLAQRQSPVFDGYPAVFWRALVKGPTYADNQFLKDRA